MQPGDRIAVAMTKWGGQAHWGFEGRFLGQDSLGEWIGVPAGTPHARPGASFVSGVSTVTLVPADGAGHLATLHDVGLWCEVYVDITTPARWDHDGPVPVLRSTDLDLDVVRLPNGTVYVDDADEFAEHQVSLGYPAEVVAAAEHSCAAVHAAVLARAVPFDGATGARWLDVLEQISDERR